MFETNSNNQEERDAFIDGWRRMEKTLERFGGLLLMLAGGLILAFDRPADQISMLIAAGLIAGGLTLIIRSRRSADTVRTHLYYLQERQQFSRSMMATVGATFLLYQGYQTSRPLFWIVGAMLGIIAAWYRWRVFKITQFTTRFKRSDKFNPSDTEDEETV